MNSFSLIVCVAVAVIVGAVQAEHGASSYVGGHSTFHDHGGHHEHKDYFAPADYTFKYGVKDPHTGDNKEQSEHRHGDHVKGQYSLHEADGTIRVVEYEADPHNGFNAVVKRIGHAHHPAHYKSHSHY